jgi:hypothetical protein
MPQAATAVCLIEARIHPDLAGAGLGTDLLRAARDNAAALGYAHLLAPIRPTRKHLEPDTPIEEYVGRTRSDGAPFDPWLRSHLRLGGRLVRICHSAMTIAGSLAEWREWTGLPLDTSGTVHVEGALNPVHVSVENDYAVYVEPNIGSTTQQDGRQLCLALLFSIAKHMLAQCPVRKIFVRHRVSRTSSGRC